MLCAKRASVTAASVMPANWPKRSSEKPSDFSWRKPYSDCGKPSSCTAFSWAMIFAIRSKNQVSHLVIACSSSIDRPARIACAIRKIRFGVWPESQPRIVSSEEASSVSGRSISFKPHKPVSIERRAFCNDSSNERPTDIASPTDFMEVDNSATAPENFSKVKRGILVTT